MGQIERRPTRALAKIAEVQKHNEHRRGRPPWRWEDWVRRDLGRPGDEERWQTNKVIEQYLIILN